MLRNIVPKAKCVGLGDAAKQILIWTALKKQGFCTSCKNSYYDDRNRGYDRSGYGHRRRQRFDEDFLESKVDFDVNKLIEFKKNFYNPHPDVLNRPQAEVEAFYKENNIQAFGRNKNQCPPPIFDFQELNLPEETLKLIRDFNYTKPTPIQSLAWPLALSGFDMVGISRTGSGKTLSFVLPALIHIQNQPPLQRGEGPIGLFIAPTRELAQQINSVAQKFARTYSLKTSCIFGGQSKYEQRESLYRSHICIATPGRLMDFLKESTLKLDRCTYCVLDEADRLLDMGFKPQINAVLNHVRPDKQMSMWSATWPREVRDLAQTFLKDYIGVKFGSLQLSANPNITQLVFQCQEPEKFDLLIKILNEETANDMDKKTLIFASTKVAAEYITEKLRRNRFSARYIHGGLSQNLRDRLLSDFRRGNLRILVGTNVVGRGLDIDDIGHVILYDFPNCIEDYVHLIGRTARHNNPGKSYTFFSYKDSPHAEELINILKLANQEVPEFLLEESRSMAPPPRGSYNHRFDPWERRRPATSFRY